MYNIFLCKFLTALLNCASYISMGLLVLIAAERYFGIINPFRSGLSLLQTTVLTTLNVVVGLAATVPIFLYTTLTPRKQCKLIWPSRSSSIIYKVVECVLFTIVPAITLAYLYWKIVKTLKRSTQNLLKSNAMSFDLETKRIRDNERITAIVMTISILFVAMVFPNRILYLVRDVWQRDGKMSKQFEYFFFIFSYIVYSLHAVANPIIYSLMDRSFRRRTVALFTCQAVPRNKKDFMSTTRTRSCLSKLSTVQTREGSRQQKKSISKRTSTTRNL